MIYTGDCSMYIGKEYVFAIYGLTLYKRQVSSVGWQCLFGSFIFLLISAIQLMAEKC